MQPDPIAQRNPAAQPAPTAQPQADVRPTRHLTSPNTLIRRIGVGAGVAAVVLGAASPAFAINPGGGRHRVAVEREAGTTHANHSRAAAKSSDDAYLNQELYKLRMCESHDNYRENTGNGYYGAYQFAMQTWQDLGMTGRPDQASPDQQDYAAKVLHARAGWSPWPACAQKENLN